MKLIEYLKKSSPKLLDEIANNHNIYYAPTFSKNWLSNQLKNKLSDHSYFQKLISTELSPQATKVLKTLSSTDSLNKKGVKFNVYQQLNQLGLIYEGKGFYYLPQDLKEIIEENLKVKKSSVNVKEQIREADTSSKLLNREDTNKDLISKDDNKLVKRDIKMKVPELLNQSISVDKKPDINFFIYTVLLLGYAHKLSENSNISNKDIQNKLFSYLNEINLTDFNTEELLDYILDYSHKRRLISLNNLKLRNNFNRWLNTDYSEKILDFLELFFPHNVRRIREIVAVLIHYPLNKEIPINFIVEELNFDIEEKGNLLNLLNIFNIRDNNLSLTPFCWRVFSNRLTQNSKEIHIIEEEVIINPELDLTKLWIISQAASLIEINDNLKFKLDEGGYLMSKNLERKYPNLKELRLKRLKGEYQNVSDEEWKEMLNRFKLEHNITGNESLRIDLAYSTLHYPI
ncbi:hypothetical protein BX659_10238 [Orenia metallireducens]|uniref:Uncharacterized protein n=1 Tax=Orenia metallireducens TaxID=1413210 RepID=A0A285F220_9FIRM|nr:hypothetical protein [Orenia metallireducens]PRX34723.1 hypothetical protein BX659_10238 [Orenia metallireducens]SNY05350.1 hypothetical protein SAMN06265827_10138 [Orenia metallireducens]